MATVTETAQPATHHRKHNLVKSVVHIELPRTQNATTANMSREFISKKQVIPYFVLNSDDRQLKRAAKIGKTTEI
ncbi:hypothetical protein ACFQUU_00405 [Herbaspirillum sp. GCM10030257]|uniref:hypothetical protein n=1 Tax=Herbaspirillum sp. GCM10030257 TaxID=3273393 RepID=UPI00361E44A9